MRCRPTAHPVLCPGALLAVDGSGMVLGVTGITALNAGRFKAFWSLEAIPEMELGCVGIL
jgi:hypothetical protein